MAHATTPFENSARQFVLDLPTFDALFDKVIRRIPTRLHSGRGSDRGESARLPVTAIRRAMPVRIAHFGPAIAFEQVGRPSGGIGDALAPPLRCACRASPGRGFTCTGCL
jgi:hypothetical protein